VDHDSPTWRVRGGAIAAGAAFVTLLALPLEGFGPEAQRLAAVMAAVVILWITEALPLPVTALLGVTVAVVLGVAPAREAFAPFADPLMFLFIGSFMLARAIFHHGLNRRLALGVLCLKWVGARPARVLLAFGAVTACLSAWISNTATTAMMFAIGMSLLTFLSEDGRSTGVLDRRWATGLMLMTSFAAAVGGLTTPVGTPPNLIGLGFIRRMAGEDLSFVRWSTITVPIALVLFAFTFLSLRWMCPAGAREIAGAATLFRSERARLGPWTRAQRMTLVAFGVTVALWVAPGIAALVAGEHSEVYRWLGERVPEGAAAMLGATLLFVLPGEGRSRVLHWSQAAEIDWGVVLLYGGGFALGVMAFDTGLAEALGRGLTAIVPASGGFALVLASTAAAVLLSETTSNTAAANMIVPVVISVAQAAGADPFEPALAATLGSSLGFMLPVSTPCNAIVYGSGRVPLRSMMRCGALLDIVGIVVVSVMVWWLAPLVR
jgi:sodium-dependent dicarboxylate transporter 2/3/5